jgi:myo-inositol 2-dehydrogenase/D-chiro-inositol 1-dehydrogenase
MSIPPRHVAGLPSPAVVPVSRRSFSATVAGGAALMVHSSRAADEEVRELRLALVGCGGRGSGAIHDSLSINDGVRLVAAADLYPAKAAAVWKSMRAAHPDKVADTDTIHAGLDGYQRILDDPTIDVVLHAAPPGFRPRHVRAAVAAGKHLFCEKPACVDPAGYRICLEAHGAAVARGTAIVTGTQYRRQPNYVAAVERIRQGEIGDVIGATSRYCVNGIWYRLRTPGMSDAEYQMNNWYHFVWLSGDQICEQAVHNIDLMNWVMGATPLVAFGSGGRFTRPADSELWDSMSVDYAYPGNRTVSFTCWQVPGTRADVGSVIYGSQGQCHLGSGNAAARIVDREGRTAWEMKGSLADAYRQEHKDLVDSIRAGKPIVEFAEMAHSSLAAVMGRLAAYTGQPVGWDFCATESKLDLFHPEITWESSLPPSEHAVPGRTKLA